MAPPDFAVHSGDASIGVYTDGEGVPVVMVHGSIADHTTFDPLVAAIASSLRAFRMDRRGFGASGDTPEYSIEQEYADVAAVVDAVVSDNVSHLVLYEPSLGLRYPAGCIESIEAALDLGDRDAAIVAVLSTILEMPPDEIDEYRQSPVWPDRLRAAHTVPRECRTEQAVSFASTSWPVGCPTMVMTGSATTDDLAAIARSAVRAIDGAQLLVLGGHDHMAPRFAPDVVAGDSSPSFAKGDPTTRPPAVTGPVEPAPRQQSCSTTCRSLSSSCSVLK